MSINKISTSIIATFVLLSWCISNSYALEPIYTAIKTSRVLATNNISGITEDSDGFIWLYTYNDIARFDGFGLQKIDSDIIADIIADNNQITCVVQNNQKMLIGTRNGLWVYDIHTNKANRIETEGFSNIYDIISGDKYTWLLSDKGLYTYDNRGKTLHTVESFHKSNINKNSCLCATPQHDIVLTLKNKIVVFHSKIGALNANPAYDVINKDTLTTNDITSRIAVDHWNTLWAHNLNGLYLIKGDKTKTLISDTEISSVYHTPDNKYTWVGMRGKGNILMERGKNGEIISHHTFPISNSNEDLSNTTNQFYCNKDGICFIATRNGLYVSNDKTNLPFKTIGSGTARNTLSHNTVTAVTCDSKNRIWVGTSSGLNKLTIDKHNQTQVEQYYNNAQLDNRIQSNKIENIIEDDNGILWLGTKNKITFFNPSSSLFYEDEKLSEPLKKCSFVRCMYKTNNGNIYLGFESGGLYKFDKKHRQIKPIVFCDDAVLSISSDQQGYIWVGTRKKGIFRLNNNDVYQQILFEDKPTVKPSINEIYCDAANNIWIGTSQGLYFFNRQSGTCQAAKFNYYDNGQKHILGIIGDNFGNIWLTSLRGIYKYSTAVQTSSYYELNKNEFIRPDYVFNCATDDNGIIYLGGINGITYFDPENIKNDSSPVNLKLTDFSILNKHVKVGSKNMTNDLNHTDKVILLHKDYQFSFEFAALTYDNSYQIRYRYKLEGLDDHWFYTDSDRRYVSYNNLSAGNYRFVVECTNKSGSWTGNVTSIYLTVKPSFWKTWWMICIISLVIILLTGVIIRTWYVWSSMKQKEQNYNWRMNFYTNVSYGFRTPITLLQAPLNKLIDNYDNLNNIQKKELLEIMRRNCKRLSRQIDRLLEFRQIETGKTPLKLTEGNIVDVIKNECSLMKSIFEKSGLMLICDSNVDYANLVFDAEKIEAVIFNLLSNALDNHSAGDVIQVKCTLDSNSYTFDISISGIKMSETADRHTKTDRQQVNELTLMLTKSYIELMKGNINIFPDEAGYCTYRFSMKLGRSHFSNQKIENNSASTSVKDANSLAIEDLDSRPRYVQSSVLPNKPTLAIIGIDDETVLFIRKLIGDQMNIIHNKRTDKSIKDLSAMQASLFLFDVDSAHTDNYFTLCKRIKNNEILKATSIIVLCEEHDQTKHQQWYSNKVDACINKPFEADYLTARIKQLLSLKEQIVAATKKEIITSPAQVKTQSDNEKFLSKAMNIIEKNMDNENFTADYFASALNMNGSLLYRRIKNLTGKSPMEFVRTIKMKRAAQLLCNGTYTISEVAYKTGYSDTRYFSTCFKKEYGVIPTEYKKLNTIKVESDIIKTNNK